MYLGHQLCVHRARRVPKREQCSGRNLRPHNIGDWQNYGTVGRPPVLQDRKVTQMKKILNYLHPRISFYGHVTGGRCPLLAALSFFSFPCLPETLSPKSYRPISTSLQRGRKPRETEAAPLSLLFPLPSF